MHWFLPLRALHRLVFEPSRAVLVASSTTLEPSWPVIGPSLVLLELSWAVLEARRAVLVALVAFLGRLGSLGEPQGGLAAKGPPKVGPIQSTVCVERGGPLEDYRNPARQRLAFFHASTCQGAW